MRKCTGSNLRQMARFGLALTLCALLVARVSASLSVLQTGNVTGRVELEGRANHSGVTIRAAGLSATTQADGRFTLTGVPAGTHVVEASLPGYLGARATDCPVASSATTTLAPVSLVGGDINQDGMINIYDLVVLAAAFGQCPPTNAPLDLTADGCVNIFDLVMLSRNYNRGGPLLWRVETGPYPPPAASPMPTAPYPPPATP